MPVTAYFRFLNLNKRQALTLEREISQAICSKDNDSYKGYVLLDDAWVIDDISNFAVQQQIDDQACDILLAPQLKDSLDVITANKIVNQMLKHIDCCISISTSPVEI